VMIRIPGRSGSRLARRLQRIEAERAELQRREREIRRVLVAAGHGIPTAPGTSASAGVPGSEPETAGSSAGGGDEDLFRWRERRRSSSGTSGAEGNARVERGSEGERFRFDSRFASYFASGSFAPRPLSEEEIAARRNRIIITLIILGVAVFIVWRLAFS